MIWHQLRCLGGISIALLSGTTFLSFTATEAQSAVRNNIPANYTPTAQAYVVMDLDSGRILYAKNPDLRLFPASTTKVMTSLVAVEHGNPNQIITASKKASETGESGIALLRGEQHTLDSLLKAALIRSANDGCVAIAEGVGGTQDRFVGWMNQKAKALGCRNTHFVNPHGLHDPNHYTTARDLALIGRAAAQNHYLSQIAAMKTAKINGNYKTGGKRLLINRNKLLWRWDESDGFKTGYTRQAGNCLVSTATHVDPTTGKKWRLLSATLKSRAGHSWPDSEWLLRKAFTTYHPQWVVKNGQVLWSGPIAGGAMPLSAQTRGEIALPLRAEENHNITHHVDMVAGLNAPIKAGQPVGSVTFYSGKTRLGQVPLQASTAVPETFLARTVPTVGRRVSFWSPAVRIAVFGGICLAFAGGLLALRPKKRPTHKRSVKTRTLVQERK